MIPRSMIVERAGMANVRLVRVEGSDFLPMRNPGIRPM